MKAAVKSNPVESIVAGLSLAQGLDAMAFTAQTGSLPGITADAIAEPTTDAAAGRFVFKIERTLTRLRFVGTGTAGGAFAARVSTVRRIQVGSAQSFTRTYVCDVSGSLSSAAVGVAGGIVLAAHRYGTAIAISNDGGLSPAQSRVFGGGLADAANDLVIDGVCDEYIVVELRMTAPTTGITVLASEVTRN